MKREVKSFWLALTAWTALGTAWALALPVNGTYDERQHIVRAYAVVTGQWVPDTRVVDDHGWPTDGFEAPASLLPADADCTWSPKPPRPASCQQPAGDGTAVLPSGAGRYHPLYYLPVGVPLLISPDAAGVVGARLVSVLLSALLLAAAVLVAVRAGNRLLVVALALVGTPLVVNLAGSVNPNGLEISAGVLLFAALITQRQVLAGTAAVLLITTRHLGPLLFGLVVLACAVAGRRVRFLWPWAVGGGVLAGAWVLASSASRVAPLENRRLDLGPGQILSHIAGDRVEFYVRQVVGQFGYGETTISLAAIALWYLLVGAVVVPAVLAGAPRLRLAIVAAFVACAVVLVALELYFVPKVGWFSHARYVMPLGVGVVLLAAVTPASRRWHAVLVALTVPVHIYALARVMTRYQRGIDAGLNPFGGSWQPAAGSWLPLLLVAFGASLLTVLVWTQVRRTVDGLPHHSTVALQTN